MILALPGALGPPEVRAERHLPARGRTPVTHLLYEQKDEPSKEADQPNADPGSTAGRRPRLDNHDDHQPAEKKGISLGVTSSLGAFPDLAKHVHPKMHPRPRPSQEAHV